MDRRSVIAALGAYGVTADTKQSLAQLKNQLEKLEVLAAVRCLTSEELATACGKHNIDTRRTMERKTNALAKLYR